MKHFQIPELQAKLAHARALAADESTPQEREAARRAAVRIEARLKEREGVKPSGPSAFNDDKSGPRTPPAPKPPVDPKAWDDWIKRTFVREQQAQSSQFQDAINRMHRRDRRENPAYRKAY